MPGAPVDAPVDPPVAATVGAPVAAPVQAWESCAVVGNSGGLLLRDDGEEIDRHEMVLRFNAAPTVGYEHQVREGVPLAGTRE